jgi:hypothetical protein
VERCLAVIASIAGPDLLCRVGREPRVALIGRSDDPCRRKRVIRFQLGKVELLGAGSQVIVDGIHPDTGQPYRWTGQPIWQLPAAQLPILTEDQERQIVERLTPILGGRKASSVRQKAKREAVGFHFPKGIRNEELFILTKDHAAQRVSRQQLEDWAIEQNASLCDPPLEAEEVRKIVGSCWTYKENDSLMLSGGEATAQVRRSTFERLKGTGATELYVALLLDHGGRHEPFAIDCKAMEKANTIGRTARTIMRYRNILLSVGLLERVGGAGKLGNPYLYRLNRLPTVPRNTPNTGV